MLLGLSKIIDMPGAEVSFHTCLDLSDMVFGSCKPVTEPVVGSGKVRNTAGVLLMSGTVSTTLHGVCDRCAADFQREVSFPIDAVLVTEEAEEESDGPWVFQLEGLNADLDDIITTVFVLNMGTKMLCKPDCKGLCCRCGKNLNNGPCDCQPELDPRLAALKLLLKDK